MLRCEQRFKPEANGISGEFLEFLVLGILRLGYKLLVNDRPKFVALLVGVTFAVFLMIEMTSLFSGALYRASATVINIGAKVWVMDPAVQTVANTIPLPDYVLDEVRSIQGVKYAVPLYSGGALVKLADGAFQSVNVVGLDDEALLGRPKLLEGNIEDIFAENGFIIVKDAEFDKFENPEDRRDLRTQRPQAARSSASPKSRQAGSSACRPSTRPSTAPALHSEHALHHLLCPRPAQGRG